MRILGIDPGLNTTGYGVIESDDFKLVEAGIIRTKANTPIHARLDKIFKNISELIEEHRPEALVLEKIYSHYKHPMTSILMAHARGAICLAIEQQKIQLINYPTTRVKKAITGRGHASKEQIQRTVASLLSMRSVPEPVDITDALALAITHANVCMHRKI